MWMNTPRRGSRVCVRDVVTACAYDIPTEVWATHQHLEILIKSREIDSQMRSGSGDWALEERDRIPDWSPKGCVKSLSPDQASSLVWSQVWVETMSV